MIEENNIQKQKSEEGRESPEELVPAELVDFISSEKTSSQISDICLKNGVSDDKKIEEVAYRIALVILGILPKEGLMIALKNGVGLDEQTAKNISAEADQLIFSQIPQSRPQHPIEIKKPTLSEEKIIEEPRKPSAKDTYREKVE